MSVGALLLKLEVANVHKPGERAGFWMPQVDMSAALIPANHISEQLSSNQAADVAGTSEAEV